MYDLPSENPEEAGLPDEFHDLQPQLLSRTLQLSGYTGKNYFTASDLNLYYDVNHPLWYKRPDWFLAINVPRLYDGKDLRRSYVTWQEGKSPYVAIEFLSPGTEVEDLGRFHNQTSEVVIDESGTRAVNPTSNGSEATATKPPAKLEVYEQYLRIPHYFVYSRYTQKLRYFKLEGGQYQEQSLNRENAIAWLGDLEIGLGIWEGVFENVPGYWLRWCDRAGNWLLTDTEQERAAKEQECAAKEQERAAKEQERAAKEQAEAQLITAAQSLLETGMEIEQVAQLLGLSQGQLKALQ
ncbi:MAG: Uma2 family endonuclease [Symploca sp. SIO2C1]|nr:Uma2 family endonuclease [Symploca sp. SIO2C1]